MATINEKLKVGLDILATALPVLMQEHEDANNKLAATEKHLLSLSDSINKQDETFKHARLALATECNDLNEKLSELQDDYESLKQERNSCSAKIKELETEIDDLHEDNEELKKEVDSKRSVLDNTAKFDAGVGIVYYKVTGSIDLQELMQQLEESIKKDGVRATITKLA